MSSVKQPISSNPGGPQSAAVPFDLQRCIEVLFILLLPVLTFWAFNIRPMHQAGSLDPWFYTGYINNTEDMLRRFDLPYYAVRFGLILPGHFFSWALGAEPGYFAFRYVLALLGGVPLYVLAKRKFSTPVAILTYCALIFSPWYERTLLWDHPDATGVPYLMAAMCLLLLARTPSWLRDGAAGCCVSLAFNSNVFTGVVFGIFGASYVALSLFYGIAWRTVLKRAVSFTAGFLLIVAAGCSYYWHVFHKPRNIFHSTFHIASLLSQGGMKVYRLQTHTWLIDRFYVFVPVLLALDRKSVV